MNLRIYDTARKKIVPFEPNKDVSIYVCGITPYDATHLGHAFTYLTFDVLTRRLEDLGHTVHMVRNVTDVDDSILTKARELKVNYLELAKIEMAKFHDDLKALNIRAAISEPTATGSIKEIISLIKHLQINGHTYTVDGKTFFDTSTFPNFGKMCGYNEKTMTELAAERGGNPDDPQQRQPLDFVLWQASKKDEPCWESPFGTGRPGWHIECSAMSMESHGPTIDLHGGGNDLIFPHHECEIAQSESVTGKTFVRHWMHVGMVSYQGTKMSKSLGNLVFINELRNFHDPRAIKLALMAHHYRSGFEWFDKEIDAATNRLNRLLTAKQSPYGPNPEPTLIAVRNYLDNDLDIPAALNSLDSLAKTILEGSGKNPDSATGLAKGAELLGIDLTNPSK